MATPFFKALRSKEALDLMKYPPAYMLLSQIAYRARRTDEPNMYRLTIGEAMIGDYGSIGVTRQQYRTAIDKLKSNQFITIRTTNKGTVAKLIDARVFDINEDSKQPSEKPKSNHPATTNKNDKNEKNEIYDQFYTSFPRKVGKKKAGEIFNKLSNEQQLKACEGAKQYAAKCQRGGTAEQYILHPATFLNQARWEDEQPAKDCPYSPDELRRFKTLLSSGNGLPANFNMDYKHLITS
jgi:hypothetical protein